MIVLLTALAFAIVAVELTLTLWKRGTPGAPAFFERLTYAATLLAALWLGTTWVLALLKLLTAPMLLARAAIVGIVAAVLLVRRIAAISNVPRIEIDRKTAAAVILALLPIGVWTEYMLWRGAVLPPQSHDALSYHLPKAVMFSRANGFRYLEELEPKARSLPVNYELLLTEFVTTQKSDKYTEWPSTFLYMFFVVAAGGLTERWWPRASRFAVMTTMLFVASVPVLLLHSGAHKNDVMVAFFMVASTVAAGRWLDRRDFPALGLVIAATALAIGTKPQAAALAAFLAPVVLWKLFGRATARQMVAVVMFGIAAFLLFGGAAYVTNIVRGQEMVGTSHNAEMVAYGDWANLWQAPYVLIAAPFTRAQSRLDVPWSSHPWFWRRYEIYFSHLGVPFAVCALALPFAMFFFRDRERRVERIATTAAAAAALGAMLPTYFQPHGMFSISLPRYALFVVPIVFGWTIPPLMSRARRVTSYALFTLALVAFGAYAIDNAVNDTFAPLGFVQWAADHPGTRVISFDDGRAASVVDRYAGPSDVIAMDAGYGSWIHPAFGAALSRPVVLIQPGQGPPVIPADADWIVIDRAWKIFWDIPGLNDLSDAERLIGRGQPSADELRVRRAVLRDPRYKVVYVRRGWNQVVLKRIR